MASIIIIGISIFINFLLVQMKVQNGNYLDAVVDVGFAMGLVYAFGSTGEGMAAATIGGALVSLWLLFKPIDFNNSNYGSY